jgi:hypothetical protein
VASEVKIKIKIDDNGSLSVVAKEADKASKATDKLGKATTKTNKTRSKYHKQEKGVAGATSNSTKSFAKQAQTIGGGSSGLVGAYATLAAHVFAVSAAFGVLSRNAGFKQLEQGIIFTGRAAGTNLPLVSKNLKEITDSAISTADAMKAVAIGTSAGFSSSQLEGLTSVAKGASLALGRDMTDALDRLVRGAAKLEPEILDELGIMVRLDKTARDYAGTLGKNVSQLSVFEKRMAFTNAIIDQGEQKFGALNSVIEANPYSKLAATFDSLLKSTIAFVEQGLGPVVSLLASNVGLLTGAIGIFAAGIVKMMVPALTQGGKAASQMAARTRDMAKQQLQSVKVFKGAPKVFTDLQKKMAAGTATEKDMVKAKASLNQSIARHQKLQKGDSVRYAKSTAEGKAKIKIIKSEEAALTQLMRVEQLEAKATLLSGRADVMHTASTGGLIATYRALTAQITLEHAALTAETQGTNLATRAKQRFTLVAAQAGLAVRAFGTAVMNAIPMIGMIVFALSLAIAGFKKFFMAPPTALEEQLKKTKEAFDDFPNVLNQMIDAYSLASTSAERFEISLKAQVGLVSQVTDQMRKLITVQQGSILAAQAKAEANLVKKQLVAKKEGGSSRPMIVGAPSYAPGFVTKGDMVQAQLNDAKKKAEEANKREIPVDETRDAMIDAITEQIAFQRVFNSVQDEGSDGLKVGISILEGYETALASLIKVETIDDINDVNKGLMAVNIQVAGVKDSFDQGAEASRKFTEHFAKMEKPTGKLSVEMELMSDAISALGNNDKFVEVFERYADAFAKFGATDAEGARRILETIKEINSETKNQKFQKGMQAGDPDTYRSALASEQTNLSNLQKQKSTQTKELQLQSGIQGAAYDKNVETFGYSMDRGTFLENGGGNADALKAAQVAKAATEKEILASQRKIAELKQEDFNARDVSGLNTGATVANSFQAGAKGTALDPTSNASTGEKFAAVNDAMSPMMENLASLGPEGALMASAMEGAMSLGETLITSFEGGKMGATEMLNAIGSAIGAINQMQQAQTKRKVMAVDKEIAAEKKRDGQSKQSLAKIKELEKKKEAMEKKAFDKNKKMQMAQVAISIATGIAGVWGGVKDPYMGPAMATAVSAMILGIGAAQLSMISGTSYEGGSSGSTGASAGSTPSSATAGERSNTVDLARSQSAVGELGYSRGESGVGNANSFKPAFTGARYRASGGSTGYMVGEQGPELFMPDTPGTIVPAGETAGAGTPSNVNISIQALDSAGVEDILISQRANIISMIRESANQVGDTFLENVDTVSDGATY